jgi:hypothetical protein
VVVAVGVMLIVAALVPTGVEVSPTLPANHAYVSGALPAATTERVVVAPRLMDLLCGWVVMEGGMQTGPAP